MPDSNLARAHIAGQAGEPQAAADVPAEVNDQAVAALLFEMVNRGIQCVRKSHPHGPGKVLDLEKANIRSDLRVNRALRFDDRRALLSPFPLRHLNHNLVSTRASTLANTQCVSLADRKVWCGGRYTSCSVQG